MDLPELNRMHKYIYLCVMLALCNCATEKSEVLNKSPDIVYKEAEELLANGSYDDAAAKFKDVESYFPYSEKAGPAQIMSAYCNFLNGSYADTIREIDIFLRYHPTHKLVPYAIYLKGVSIYMNVSTVGRDSKEAKEAREVFIELVNKFPNSPYAKDSLKKITILEDTIVAHELMIGRFYQKNKNAAAAINRYNYVIAKFPTSRGAEEAYFRLIECCKSEGLTQEADEALQAFKTYYPNSEWIKRLEDDTIN